MHIENYETWKTQKLHTIGQNIIYALPENESIMLKRANTGQIVHDHRDLFAMAISEHNKKMEEKHDGILFPSFRVLEYLAELEKQQKSS